MLKHDIKLGVIKYIWIYVILGCLVFWGSAYFYQCEQQSIEFGDLSGSISGFSMLLYIFQGNEKYVPNPENTFQLSILWLLPLILIGYVIYAYPVNDLKTYGYNYMIRTRSRSYWWFAKLVWLLLHIIISGAVIALSAALCAWTKGEPFFEMPGKDLLESLGLSGMYDMDMLYLPAILVLVFITILALSTLQLMLSFIFSPLVAYVGLIVVYVTSVYCTTWVLPGNYLMLLRMTILSGNGINQWIGLPFMGTVWIVALFSGRAYMKRYDIL